MRENSEQTAIPSTASDGVVPRQRVEEVEAEARQGDATATLMPRRPFSPPVERFAW